MHEETVKRNIAIREPPIHLAHHSIEENMIKKDEYQENEQQHQHRSSLIEERTSSAAIAPILTATTTITTTTTTRSNNLTEIDENDFFYQGPSPYSTVIDLQSIADQTRESPKPTYKIDEFIDEDEHDERDHVKELEETIANLSRHFPHSTSSQIDSSERNPIATVNLQQSSALSATKIDIDSILEMEIESPSMEKGFIESSSLLMAQHSLNNPISIPITVPNRRGSLSRSSGVRENLTNLLTTASHSSDRRPLQRTTSSSSKVKIEFCFFSTRSVSIESSMKGSCMEADILPIESMIFLNSFQLPSMP